MKKRLITVLVFIMTVSMCTVLLASCGKTTVETLSQQKTDASDVVELPALQPAESIAPEAGSNIEVTSGQTEESIAPEVSTDVEMSSERITEELISHVWEGSLGDEHYTIVFGSDNFARHTLTDSDGEWQGEGMHSWGLKGNEINLFWEDTDLTATYSKESDKGMLVFQDDRGNVILTLTATEKYLYH